MTCHVYLIEIARVKVRGAVVLHRAMVVFHQRTLARIRMSAQRSKCAVDLFREHGARQLMRKSHGRKRKQQIRPRLPFARQAIVAADQEHQILGGNFAARDNICKLRRAHCPAPWVEKNLVRRGVSCEQVETAEDYLPHLAIGITAAAFQELGRNGICMLVSGLANVIEEQLHRTLSMGCSTEQ